MGIHANSEIVAISTGERGSDWDAFLACLPPDNCAYALVEPPYIAGQKEALVFVVWLPETAKIREKMIFASFQQPFYLRYRPIIELGIAATDRSELYWPGVQEKMQDRVEGKLAKFRRWDENRHASLPAFARAILLTILILARSEQPNTRARSHGLCQLSNVALKALFRCVCRMTFREA